MLQYEVIEEPNQAKTQLGECHTRAVKASRGNARLITVLGNDGINTAYPAAVNGASNGAAAPEEGADSDEVLSLFDTEAAGADEVLDDSLIDEVFSAM